MDLKVSATIPAQERSLSCCRIRARQARAGDAAKGAITSMPRKRSGVNQAEVRREAIWRQDVAATAPVCTFTEARINDVGV